MTNEGQGFAVIAMSSRHSGLSSYKTQELLQMGLMHGLGGPQKKHEEQCLSTT